MECVSRLLGTFNYLFLERLIFTQISKEKRDGKLLEALIVSFRGFAVFTVGKETKGYTEVHLFPFWQQVVRD